MTHFVLKLLLMAVSKVSFEKKDKALLPFLYCFGIILVRKIALLKMKNGEYFLNRNTLI